MPETPDFFAGRRAFADPVVAMGVFQRTSFHDAALDHSTLRPQGLDLRLWWNRFLPDPEGRQGTKGAELRLVFAKWPAPLDLVRAWDLFDRSTYWIVYHPTTSQMEFQVDEIHDLFLSIDPARSTFEWLWRPIPGS